MPGEVDDSVTAIKDKLILIANGIIMLLIISLASQHFLVLESYLPNNHFWLSMLLTVVAVILGILEAKKAVEVRTSTGLVFIFNLFILGSSLWLIGFNYSQGLLLGVGAEIFILYRLATSLAQRVEYLRLDFDNLSKAKQETQGLNFKRHGKILQDIKLIFFVIDSLVVISWLVAQEIQLIIILSGVSTLMLQFLLWQIVVLIIKGLNWFLKKFKVDFNVFIRSISWSLLIIIIISCLAFVLPVQYGNHIGDLIAANLDNWYEETSTGITLDLKKIRQDVAEKTAPPNRVESDWNNEVNWSTILFFIAVIITGIILIVWFGLLVIFIIKGEVKKIKQLPSLIIDFIKFCAKICKGWFDLFKSGTQKIKEFVPKGKKKLQELQEKATHSQPKSSNKYYQQEVMRLFNRLLELLEKNGLEKEKFATVDEYFDDLQFELSLSQKKLVWLKEVIDRAIYSQEQIDYQTKERLKKLIDNLEQKY